MIQSLDPTDFLAIDAPLLDVRSPGEHEHAHIPGAQCFPLFSNEERAVVGTLYKQQGRDDAMLEGLRFVGPRMATMVERARSLAPDGLVRVHCWRGGERSASVAWLLDRAGLKEVSLLKGGYKAYRGAVLKAFDAPWDLRIIGGYTGTGKTELLGHLKELGQQTIDLEALANHKGSSYGAIGEDPQPGTEQFENLLFDALRCIDHHRPIWVEDESQLIGRVKIPDDFFKQMRDAPCFFVDMPRDERAQRLVADYGAFPKDELVAATKRIEKRIGPQHCKTALEALERGDLHTVAMITLNYYDKTYTHGLGKRDPVRITKYPANAKDLRAIAQEAIASHARSDQA